MKYLYWWLGVAVPCFFLMYCSGEHMDGRMKSLSTKKGFWNFHKNFFIQGFKLLVYDYFGLYCPWSWERARRYRLEELCASLGSRAYRHEKLGIITMADYDPRRPERQEEIARLIYVSRMKYWSRGALLFFIAPLKVFFIILLVGIGGIVRLGRCINPRR